MGVGLQSLHKDVLVWVYLYLVSICYHCEVRVKMGDPRRKEQCRSTHQLWVLLYVRLRCPLLCWPKPEAQVKQMVEVPTVHIYG